jgi:hypothetical protein
MKYTKLQVDSHYLGGINYAKIVSEEANKQEHYLLYNLDFYLQAKLLSDYIYPHLCESNPFHLLQIQRCWLLTLKLNLSIEIKKPF